MSRTPVWRRYARLFGADPKADIKDELQFHLAAKVDDLVARGWTLAEARKEAERQFGDLERIQEMGEHFGKERESRQRRADYLEDLAQDLRYALRTLRMQPGFTSVSILILALGIAANTSVFSVVNTILLRPLPFPDADRLAWLQSDKNIRPDKLATAGLSAITYTVDAFEQYKQHNQSFESVAAYNPFFGNGEMTMTGRGDPQHLLALMVTNNYFDTLGVRLLRGRMFEPDESQKNGRRAVILSYAFWQRQLGGDPAIVGQAINLNKQPFVVVGILPREVDFGSVFSPGLRVDVYIPVILDELRTWGNTLAVVGRLKNGVTIARAQAEADILFPQIKQEFPKWWSDYSSTITSLKEHVSGKLQRSLVVLWSAVGLILLIVCVNLSNLQLARAAARGKEFAMRAALGAGRGRLFRQLMTESVALGTSGALLGLALAYGLTFYLAHQGSVALPLLSMVTIDGAALGWTMFTATAASLLFGLVPGLRLASGNLQDALKSTGSAGMTAGRSQERLRSLLVVSEVAFACVLLISAGLLMRSFLNVLDVDLGFRPSQAAVIKIDYDDEGRMERRATILEEIQRNVLAIPGIEAAGVTDMLPLGRNRTWGLRAKGQEYAKASPQGAMVRIVTPGYVEAAGVRLRGGRDFSWSDTAKSEPVVIINEAAARHYWANDDPVGRTAIVNGRDTRVIGVIADVRQQSVETAAGPEMYLPVTASEPEGAELVVRTKLPPEAIAATVLKTLRSSNPAQPATQLEPLESIVDKAVSPRRFFVLLVASFAVLGMILASLGIYGVISYSVTRQTQEIGIRMALGASGHQVQAGFVGSALRLAASGALCGSVVSLLAARWIASMLFGTRPTDPITFAGIVVLLCVVAVLAGYLPARRASRIEPMIALRAG